MSTRLCLSALMAILIADTAVAQRKSPKQRRVAQFLKQLDKNEDGVLDESELTAPLASHLAPLDVDKDGKLSVKELVKMKGRPGQRSGEIITGAATRERYDDRLSVGDLAPDFTLADPTGKNEVTLSSYQGKKPVVLIFGSYT